MCSSSVNMQRNLLQVCFIALLRAVYRLLLCSLSLCCLTLQMASGLHLMCLEKQILRHAPLLCPEAKAAALSQPDYCSAIWCNTEKKDPVTNRSEQSSWTSLCLLTESQTDLRQSVRTPADFLSYDLCLQTARWSLLTNTVSDQHYVLHQLLLQASIQKSH